MAIEHHIMKPGLLQRYLDLLHIPCESPSLDGLRRIVQAHLCSIPFENISKLHYFRTMGLTNIPDLKLYLDGIEHHHFGGTCYSNNYHLYQLLANLGYDVRLCGADMNNPDCHLVIMVKLDGREYLVDGGYAAPFLKPMPRDLDSDYEIQLGQDLYVLKPQDEQRRSRLVMYRNGEARHGYIAKPESRHISEFAGSIAHSFRSDATFLNSLLLTKFYSDHSLVINNLNVIESRGTESTIQVLANRKEIVIAIEKHFGIPTAITETIVNELPAFGDAWN